MTAEDKPLLERILAGEDEWRAPRFDGDHMDVHVSTEYSDFVEGALADAQIEYDVMISDLGAMIAKEAESVGTEYAGLDDFDYEQYHTLEVYQQWQTDFVEANSDIASKHAYGESYEKRELNYMKIGKGEKESVLNLNY